MRQTVIYPSFYDDSNHYFYGYVYILVLCKINSFVTIYFDTRDEILIFFFFFTTLYLSIYLSTIRCLVPHPYPEVRPRLARDVATYLVIHHVSPLRHDQNINQSLNNVVTFLLYHNCI